MKIMIFSDVHADLKEAASIAKRAKSKNVDLMICAGDMSFFGQGIQETVSEFDVGIPLLIIPGNHETEGQIEAVERKFHFVKNIHLKSRKINSVNFFGCGGSNKTPFSTPNELTEKEFKNMLSTFKDNGEEVFFVTHEPPFNTKLDFIGAHKGNKAIRQFIEKYRPSYCICGHFHENAGKEDKIGRTRIINPGDGKIIEI
jgi:Icc-related predicted phosphoesterase